MSPGSLARKQNKPKITESNTPFHDQIMDYLQMANSSTNPAIVEISLSLAQERQKQQHKAEAKLSPITATILTTVAFCLCVTCCWFALVHYPGTVGYELTVVFSTLAFLMVSFYALFSGQLSQENVMKVLEWAFERFKQLKPISGPELGSVSLEAAREDLNPTPKNEV